MATYWTINQPNLITFVLVDAAGNEVAGLGTNFNVFISKAGGSFVAGAGTKGEIGYGWYRYEATAQEADTAGPVAVRITATGVVQQNLEYIVLSRQAGCINFTYTVRDNLNNPVPDVRVWISVDDAAHYIIWAGMTDNFGVARDAAGKLPCLTAGTYYFWKHKVGMIDDQNPDVETVG